MDGGEETGARVRQIAGDVLGLADLRPAQMEAAAALAAGRDCLAVLPSGAGKSAIYQIAGGLLTAGDHSDGCHAAVRSAHVGHQARQADRAHRTQAPSILNLNYRFKHPRMEACRTPGLPSVLSHRIWSGGRCDCGFDVIEESLKYQAMKRLDPLTPDRLVLPDRAAFERVAKNRPAFGKLQLEPVLELELIRPDHPERTRGTRAIELFPQHRPGVVQTVSLQPGSRSDFRRPDTAEVRDERNDPLWRCRDNPLVAFPDLHPSLTSPHVPCDQCRDATVRSPRLRKRSCRAAPPTSISRARPTPGPRRRLMAPAASRHEHAHFRFPSSHRAVGPKTKSRAVP